MNKMRALYILLVCSFFTTIGIGQTPEPLNINRADLAPFQNKRVACQDQFAGNSSQMLAPTAMSNSTTDPLYLCFGDSLYVDHIGNVDLSGDPDMSTPSGITYAFYSCPPTISGPNLADILNDPCLFYDPLPIDINGDTTLYYVQDLIDVTGDATFFNLGALQNFFNNGDPVQVWFSPLTIDDWGNFLFEQDVSGELGPCVNSNTADAFSVVYVNQILATNPVVGVGGDPCVGSFVLDGGAPEFDGSNYTNINITLNGNLTVTANIQGGPFTHGETVTFTVPEPGAYNIIIEDDKSCSGAIQMSLPGCPVTADDINLSFPDLSGDTGTEVCLPLEVEDFNDLLTMQFSLSWDPSILEFSQITNLNMAPGNNLIGTPPGTSPGSLTFSWDAADIVNGETLPDGTIIFEVCFTLVGAVGECGTVEFSNSPTFIEVVDISGNALNFSGQGGKINIGNPPLVFMDSVVTDISCFGAMDGAVNVTFEGGLLPLNYNWSNGLPSEDADNLGPGPITLIVSDSNNPPETLTFTWNIEEPDPITIDFPTATIISCNVLNTLVPTNDGTSTAVASGGTSANGEYFYIWQNGLNETAVTSNNVFLPGGFSFVQVTDDNGCMGRDSVFIAEPPQIQILDATINSPNCHGEINGSLQVTATGGTAPNNAYTYDWDNSVMGNLNDNIAAGEYIVTVLDENLCFLVDTFEITEPDTLIAITNTLNTTDTVGCSGTEDGVFSVTVTGGNTDQPYSYNWSSNVLFSVDNTAQNLSSGNYSVTVLDSKGCSDIVTHTIYDPSQISAIIPNPPAPPCFGQQTYIKVDSVWGGSGGPYSFTVNLGSVRSTIDSIQVPSGTHTVTIFDNDNCTFERIINIPEPPEIQVDLGPDVEIELGDSTTLMAGINPVGRPFSSFIWTPVDDLRCKDSLCTRVVVNPTESTLYTLTVTDFDGCTGTDQILVEVDNKRYVYIPNIFTPNGDGFNDIFRVYIGQGVQQVNYMRIFSRWGTLVYEVNDFYPGNSDDDSFGWNGRFNEEELDPAVFIYLIQVEFIDGRTLLYRGDVTLFK